MAENGISRRKHAREPCTCRHNNYLTRSTGTVHTSIKVRLTSVTISGSLPKFSHLFICPLPTFPGNFMQIRLEVFVQSC